MTSLLLIEDDPVIGDEIVARLEPCGYAVRWAKTVEEAAAAAQQSPSDVLIVDRMLPDGDGLDVLRDLRAGGDRTPALVLSALDRVDQRVAGLRAGGDDYLVKPFAFDELAARLEALLRRPSELPQVWLRLGPLELNLIDGVARARARPRAAAARVRAARLYGAPARSGRHARNGVPRIVALRLRAALQPRRRSYEPPAAQARSASANPL